LWLSSISIVFFPLGGLNKINWVTAPRLPCRVDAGNIFKRGDSSLVEVPLSAYFAPYLGTTMRVFPAMTSVQRYFAHLEAGFTGKPVVFGIHLNEVIDESGGNGGFTNGAATRSRIC